ncbi:MAG: EAL domain-containing protein [Lachnospiraceae bacterium]|nr:EAL domain-containing protein [Lachnospiraceae bacterium]
MNIELQCCALFILLTILVMFHREKKLDLMNRKLFLRAVYACFACLTFDIVSVIFITISVNEGVFGGVTKIICKLYIMLLVLQGYYGYQYVSTNLLPRNKTWAKVIRIISHTIFGIGEVLMFVLPISYTVEGRIVYSFGPSTSVAYALSAVFILATITLTFAFKKKMPGRRFMAMLLWQGTWLLAAFIQFVLPQLLLVGFASAFGMVILYIQLENPSEFIDGTTGLFTTKALSAYVHDKYKFGKRFSLFTAKIHYLTDYVDYSLEQEAVMRTSAALVNLGPEPAFRIDDETFCVLYDDEKRMVEMHAEIKRLKDGATFLPAKGTYLLIKDSTLLTGPEEFFSFLHNYLETEQEILIADEDMVQKLRDQNSVKAMIDEALKEDRVEVFFQPIFNVRESRFSSAEALVRIRLENGDIVPPAKFISVAEENGQIIQLGIRVFEKVCQFFAKGESRKYGLNQVEVNVSAAQFDHENPAKFVLENIEKYKIDSSWINLEITETAAGENQDVMVENMEKLIANGVNFSLDDFGTGRSNIDYFVNMPVNIIKFDYKFTRGFFENEKIKYVLTGMVDIFHKMNQRVVVEGIETEEQMKTMKDMDIEFIQGFYYSKPVPESEFVEFLKEHNTTA